ncbi:ABC transporter permease [candidate division KSB1 bacterium]|nr:ABC transporter permease [candidate division KSB1 bacterium]RQW00836.1 MAG: ABC transporter permease [candidate division KSB1 bacterium]
MIGLIKKKLDVLGPFVGLLFVFVIFVFLAPASFVSGYNLKTIVTQTVIVGLGALGMTFVIVGGGIDLSVGSIIALVTIVTAKMLNWLETDQVAFVWLAAFSAIVVGALVGLLNGLITAMVRIVPFIVTLGMMQITRGVAKWLAREQTVIAPQTILNNLMNVDPEPAWLVFAPGVWTMIGLTALVYFILKYTVFGRYVFALGSNEQAARLCGIKVRLNRIWIYTLCGAFTGVAGLMQFANLTLGDPTAAVGLELDIIAAVVIGGGSLSGGEGGAIGSIIGALMMAILRNGCNLVGIPTYVQNILIGSIIIGAVAVDRLKHKT